MLKRLSQLPKVLFSYTGPTGNPTGREHRFSGLETHPHVYKVAHCRSFAHRPARHRSTIGSAGVGMPLEYIAGMRARATRRKSKWNLLLIAFAVAGTALSWYGLVKPLLSLRSRFFPNDAFLNERNPAWQYRPLRCAFFPFNLRRYIGRQFCCLDHSTRTTSAQ